MSQQLIICLLTAFIVIAFAATGDGNTAGDLGNSNSNAVTVLEMDFDEEDLEVAEALEHVQWGNFNWYSSGYYNNYNVAPTSLAAGFESQVVEVSKNAQLPFSNSSHCVTHCSVVQNPSAIGTPYCSKCTAGFYIYKKPATGCYTLTDAIINVTMFNVVKSACEKVCSFVELY